MADDVEVTIGGNREKIVLKPIPSLLAILKHNAAWKSVYDAVDGGLKGLMTEDTVNDFHAVSVSAVDRLNHAGFTPDQISMETGLMPAKVDVIFEALGVEKKASPVMPASPAADNVLPACHLWEVDHDYSSETTYDEMKFESWEDFLSAMGKAEKCWNFLYRWDWYERDEETDNVIYKGDDNERTGFVKLCYQAQRKGFSMCARVKVARNDEPKVRAYLQEHWKYMEDMWTPISNGTSLRVKEKDLAPRTPEQLVENQYEEILYGSDDEKSQRIVREALGDINPNKVKWVRYRFTATYKSYYPIVFPPAGPFAVGRDTRMGEPYIVIAFLPEGVPFEKYWVGVTDVQSHPVGNHIGFPMGDYPAADYWSEGDRVFHKPKWWPTIFKEEAKVHPDTPSKEELARYERFQKGDDEEKKRQVIEELGGLHPDQVKWVRHRFYTHHEDSRPVKFPPPGPWWCSGSTDDVNGEIQIIVAYLPENYEIKKYWPEVGEVSFSDPGPITFTDRFSKPDWWPF